MQFTIKKSSLSNDYKIWSVVDGEDVAIATIHAETGLDIILDSKYHAEIMQQALILNYQTKKK